MEDETPPRGISFINPHEPPPEEMVRHFDGCLSVVAVSIAIWGGVFFGLWLYGVFD